VSESLHIEDSHKGNPASLKGPTVLRLYSSIYREIHKIKACGIADYKMIATLYESCTYLS